jgi:cell division protein FtsQ
MSAVSARTDRRFRRAHVKPGRKRRWYAAMKPLLGWTALLAGLTYGVYRTSIVAAQAHVLRVDRIVVRGNGRLTDAQVMAMLNGLRGESLMWTDLEAWRARLLASPWIRDAALRRSLPSTVEITVTERTPIGIARIDGELYLVDESGVLIDEYGPHFAEFDLPIVDGLPAADAAGAVTDEARAALAAQVIAAVKAKPQLANRLSQVDVSDAHNARVILTGDGARIQLGEDRFLTRLQSYLDLAPTLRERVAEIDSVDLRFDDRIYVRPAARRRQSSGGAQFQPRTGRKPEARQNP